LNLLGFTASLDGGRVKSTEPAIAG